MKAHRSVYLFACPTCRARVGERCSTQDGSTHARRVRLVTRYAKKGKKGSVRAVSGGGIETNRRKH